MAAWVDILLLGGGARPADQAVHRAHSTADTAFPHTGLARMWRPAC
jgi:hypothetical protein